MSELGLRLNFVLEYISHQALLGCILEFLGCLLFWMMSFGVVCLLTKLIYNLNQLNIVLQKLSKRLK